MVEHGKGQRPCYYWLLPMALSPLAGGRLIYPGNPAALRLVGAAKQMSARCHGATLKQLACARIMAHPSSPLPIIVTNKLERLKTAAQAGGIVLEREDRHAPWEAAQGRRIP